MDADYGYLWRKPGSRDPNNPRLVDRQEPTDTAETVQKMYWERDDSKRGLTEAFMTAEGEYKAGFLEQVHKLFVDPSGDLFKILEKATDDGVKGVLLGVRETLT